MGSFLSPMRTLAFSLVSILLATAPAAFSNKEDDAEKVDLKTTDNMSLAASFYLPKDTSSLVPGVLLVHDAGSSRRQLDELAERLQRSGFAVLSMDLRGHGESTSDGKPWAELSEKDHNTLWAFAPRDVEAASQWLARRKEVHSTNINIVGVRAASALATRQASRDQNVMAVVLVEPETETLGGFNMKDEIVDLEGLPTAIMACKSHVATAEAIARIGNEMGDPYVEVIESKSKEKSDTLERRQIQDIVKWLQSKSMPRKGR